MITKTLPQVILELPTSKTDLEYRVPAKVSRYALPKLFKNRNVLF